MHMGMNLYEVEIERENGTAGGEADAGDRAQPAQGKTSRGAKA
jgi:hypothetical protein